MTTSISVLLSKLRLLEAAVPRSVRANPNFAGLRVDEEGSAVYVGKYDFPDGNPRVNADPKGVEMEVYGDPVFQKAMGEASVVRAARIDPANLDSSSGCYAGDGAYSAKDGDREREQARPLYGTLGWFFFLDNVPVAVSCCHLLYRYPDVPENQISVYQYTDSLKTDVRVGRLWKCFLAQGDAERIFDIALARLEDPAAIVGEFGQLADGSTRDYPQRLATEEVIAAGESYYLVGAHTRTRTVTSFLGVGSRRQEDGSMLSEQLFFERCSSGGDSGATIVHVGTNSVVAICTMTGLYTVASPLYRKGWKSKGMMSAGGFTLPAFDSTRL